MRVICPVSFPMPTVWRPDLWRIWLYKGVSLSTRVLSIRYQSFHRLTPWLVCWLCSFSSYIGRNAVSRAQRGWCLLLFCLTAFPTAKTESSLQDQINNGLLAAELSWTQDCSVSSVKIWYALSREEFSHWDEVSNSLKKLAFHREAGWFRGT